MTAMHGEFRSYLAAISNFEDEKLKGMYGPSLTVQSQAEDADINVMMARMKIGHQMPQNPKVPIYGDFSHITDYRSAIEATRAAQEDFMTLPAQTRSKFDNDPQKLLEFVHSANAEQMKEMFGERIQAVAGADRAPVSPSGGGAQGQPGAATGGAGDGGQAAPGGATVGR